MRLDGIDLLRGLAISFVLGGRSPSFFLAAIVMAGLLGDVVANVYSQPMNRLLRVRTGENRFGSAVEAAGNPPATRRQITI